jgi:NADP-dependent 3-hydroxy acid dehydrogenase YdfG
VFQLQALAEHGAHVIIASRSLDRSQAAAEKIMVWCYSALSVLDVRTECEACAVV